MREKIDEKIREIVDYIIGKPVNKITLDEYTILRDVRNQESAADSQERMAKLLSVATGGFGPA